MFVVLIVVVQILSFFKERHGKVKKQCIYYLADKLQETENATTNINQHQFIVSVILLP